KRYACAVWHRSHGMIFVVSLFCFFFSSRRRHTRCLSDWSSDVCSSDLANRIILGVAQPVVYMILFAPLLRRALVTITNGDKSMRSEERRVGKECRSRWAAED